MKGKQTDVTTLYKRNNNDIRTNDEYLAHKDYHQTHYNPNISWYEWQSRKKGKEQLCRQNDIAYGKYVSKKAGLHEQHLAEELHRYSVFPAQYTDAKGTVSVDPSVPPMGDPFRFHGSIWTGKRFDDMWIYWTRLYPAHAYDIERELFNSKKEIRTAWWDVKLQRTPDKHVPNKKNRINSNPQGVVTPIRTDMTARRSKGYFELTYLDTPCRICGGLDHPALREVEDNYGHISYKYICKIATADDWETISMKPCPEKLAREGNYDEQEVEKIWVRMMLDGWGQNQPNRTNSTLLRMARYYCEEKFLDSPNA